jgi:hypothetical protein
MNESWVPLETTDERARMGHNFDAEYEESRSDVRELCRCEQLCPGARRPNEYVPPYDYINDPLGMLHD